MKILLRNSFYTNEEKNIKTIKKKNKYYKHKFNFLDDVQNVLKFFFPST